MKLRGVITPTVARIVNLLSMPNDQWFGPRTGPGAPARDIAMCARRARRIDLWTLLLLLILCVCYHIIPSSNPHLQWLAVGLAVWIPIHVLAVTTKLALFDHWRDPPERVPAVASHTRIVVNGLTNYVQLWIAFACLYSALRRQFECKAGFPRDWFDPLYFSAVTQFTIGYGDIAPTGLARAVVVAHGFASMLLLLLLLGRFVSLLRREDSLDEGKPLVTARSSGAADDLTGSGPS